MNIFISLTLKKIHCLCETSIAQSLSLNVGFICYYWLVILNNYTTTWP